MSDRLQIAPGVALPFYPMRPRMGVRLTAANALATISALHETHVFQPKLNGDRVLLAKQDNRLYAFNRHYKPFAFKFDLKPWQGLPNGSCLDGEVKDGKFHPFEVVALSGASLCPRPVEDRIQMARNLCASANQPYLFDLPNLTDYVAAGVDATPEQRNAVCYWEGVVAKKKGSRYNILGLQTENPSWIKLKWEYAV